MAVKRKNVIDHRERKNPRSRQQYREDKHKQNEWRGKQSFDPVSKTWSR